jgi:hypothetical protein
VFALEVVDVVTPAEYTHSSTLAPPCTGRPALPSRWICRSNTPLVLDSRCSLGAMSSAVGFENLEPSDPWAQADGSTRHDTSSVVV